MDWRDAEWHAGEARANGWRVEMKLVEGAEHVQMFRGKEGEGAYWEWVGDIVSLGLGGDEA